ncbi:Myotubularin-like phosphatase domain-containing protein, partial [Zopfochytrium polystomum]
GLFPLHVVCRHFVFAKFFFEDEQDSIDLFSTLQRLVNISSIDQHYAFYHQPTSNVIKSKQGWNVFDPTREFERMGLGTRTQAWRITTINNDFSFSSTYPRIIGVPARISDNVLKHAGKFRSKCRIPALSYIHQQNFSSITRSAQPLVGLKSNRSIQDERLIESVFSTGREPPLPGHQHLIIDARPSANAMAQTALGAGTESSENYRNCRIVFSGIENIHVVRDSYLKLLECTTIQSVDTGPVTRAALDKSGWLKHVKTLLDGAHMIVQHVHVYNNHVLVHCSDGWDRTAQLCSLAEMCLDPYYRTIEGFQVLIEKEWIAFGHKFSDRLGHLAKDTRGANQSPGTTSSVGSFASADICYPNTAHPREVSPVFTQFLDSAYQLWTQFPTHFEFNEAFLIALNTHAYSCQFGTFLFNNEKDR